MNRCLEEHLLVLVHAADRPRHAAVEGRLFWRFEALGESTDQSRNAFCGAYVITGSE